MDLGGRPGGYSCRPIRSEGGRTMDDWPVERLAYIAMVTAYMGLVVDHCTCTLNLWWCSMSLPIGVANTNYSLNHAVMNIDLTTKNSSYTQGKLY